MSNGTTLTINEAASIIDSFVGQERRRSLWLRRKKKIVVGQKLDLNILKAFIAEVDKHNARIEQQAESSQIKAVRIYFGKSDRKSRYKKELYDLVLVPVVGKNTDLYRIYDKENRDVKKDMLVGNTLPCPNVCPDKESFYCPQ